MKLAALLLLLLAQGEELALVGRSEAPAARWELSGETFEVGQPFEATLVVQHGPGAQVELAREALEADLSWLVFEAPELLAPAPGDGLQPQATRWSVRLASLEPGERELPRPPLALQTEAGSVPVEIEPRSLAFTGVLGPDEDQPRPPREFRPVDPERASSLVPWLLAGGVTLVVLGLALALWLRSRRSRKVSAAPPTPRERLEALGRLDLDSPDSVRRLHYELTALLREQVDLRQAASRSALTDEEWLALASAGLAAEPARELSEILRASSEVKYGPHHPTAWAVRETLEKAARVLSAAEPAKVAA